MQNKYKLNENKYKILCDNKLNQESSLQLRINEN